VLELRHSAGQSVQDFLPFFVAEGVPVGDFVEVTSAAGAHTHLFGLADSFARGRYHSQHP